MKLCRTLIGILIVTFCTGCREQILHNLDEREANRVLTRLAKVQISASRDRGSDGLWSISVHNSDAREALQHLEVTRTFPSPTRDQREPKANIFASREEQQHLYERSISRELEETLQSMQGVLEARVHLNLPSRDPLFGGRLSQAKPSASALVITSDEFGSEKGEVALLISAAAGVPADSVEVLLNRASPPPKQNPINGAISSTIGEGGVASALQRLVRSVTDQSIAFQVGCSLLVIGGALMLRFVPLSLTRNLGRKRFRKLPERKDQQSAFAAAES